MDARRVAEDLVSTMDQYLDAVYVKRDDADPIPGRQEALWRKQTCYEAREDLIGAFEKMLLGVEAQIKREIEDNEQ